MVETSGEHERSTNDVDVTLNIYPVEWELHVREVVELELWIPQTENAKFQCSPIHLKLDINNESRYFAYHDTGLHAVSIEFIKELDLFFAEEGELHQSPNANVNDFNPILTGYVLFTFPDGNGDGPIFQTPSHVEYIVCTKALNNTKANTVFGFALLQSPSGLLLLLASGQVVTLDVITRPSNLRNLLDTNVDPLQPNVDSQQLKKWFSEPFDVYIRNILANRSSQPLLKLDKSQCISPKESIELFVYATDVLREQYILKHEKVKQEIEKRVKILQLLKRQQELEIAQMEVDKTQIKNDAERLAELYEEINDRQQVLFKRCQEVIRLINLRMPRGETAEKNYAIQLERLESVTKNLSNNLELAKNKMYKQEEQVRWQEY